LCGLSGCVQKLSEIGEENLGAQAEVAAGAEDPVNTADRMD